MRVTKFDFEVPSELIAQKLANPRDSARMLIVPPNGHFIDSAILDLAHQLQPRDLIVLNNTKVIPAKLFGSLKRSHNTSASISITLHKRESGNRWRAFANPAKKLSSGETIYFSCDFQGLVEEKLNNGEVMLQLNYSDPKLIDTLNKYGNMPIPPYIKRCSSSHDSDMTDYQTIYAKTLGAVAAPTAGLHFTDRLFNMLDEQDIDRDFITLHVGAGTFIPVKVDDTKKHVMHSEWGSISNEVADKINLTKRKGGRIIAVGTTTLRLLESASDSKGYVKAFAGNTKLFITPGYKFQIVDILLTNFHLPRSTLFMLVSAFSGLDKMQKAYGYAKTKAYRFFSYGDACLLHRDKS